MADPKGFMTTPRRVAARRPVAERIHDWKEVYSGTPGRAVLPIISEQAGRCMDCGIPFCHTGCPLGNLIPEWNDLIWRSDWDERRVTPQPPEWHTGKTVAVIGSGPAGLAAAQQLSRAGHTVAVYERSDE